MKEIAEKNFNDLYFLDNIIKDNDLIYSIDMLRVNCKMTIKDFEHLKLIFFSRLYNDYQVEYYEQTRMQSFRYNYVVSYNDTSIYFGFMPNSTKFNGSDKDKIRIYQDITFVVEFNPNKIKQCDILFNLFRILNNKKWNLKSCDFAIDIKKCILDLNFVNLANKHKYNIIYGEKGEQDKTFYFGSAPNRIKVYNKKIESNLKDIDYLTRIEISKTFEDLNICDILSNNIDFNITFPAFYYNTSKFTNESDIKYKALLYALNDGIINYKQLGRKTKERLIEFSKEKSKIAINPTFCNSALFNTLCFYFPLLFR